MKTNKIFIVGGGSAGWMTAATLIHQFPEKDITLIESPRIGTIGVGESTIGQINKWMSLLDIKDEDFMPYTDASYKLSIRFEDFYQLGDGGFHYPFGQPYEREYSKEVWTINKILNPEIPYKDYADCLYDQMALVNNNTITKNEDKIFPNYSFKNDTAYHFDATKFGLWLRDHYCLPKGVKHIQEDIDSVESNENGIISLNGKHTADLYIDCTGFKSLLLGETLKVPFESYEEMLPNNKAWATRVPYKNKEQQLEPYTNCTAIENGWVWNIPSWERIGTGYVYSDKYVSDEEALEEFKRHLTKKGHDFSESEFKNIKMRVGIHKELFVKNVCAIGLSSGFIEPLESNGLFTTHEFLNNLVRTLNRGDRTNVSQWDKDAFNSASRTVFREFAEFVSMHYAMSHRDDTQYWRDVGNRQYSKHLIDMVPAFVNGHVSYAFCKFRDFKYNSNGGMHCIATGMRNLPIDKPGFIYENLDHNVMDYLKEQNQFSIDLMNKTKRKWDIYAKSCPTLYSFLKENIHKGE
jgi:tryptophan halogenase